MTDQHMQLTLRDLRGFLGQPKVLACLVGAAVLATVAQPFGFRVPGTIGLTFVYWLLMIFVTFPLGFLVHSIVEHRLARLGTFAKIACAAVIMGLCVTIIVYLMNAVFLGWGLMDVDGWTAVSKTAFPSGLLVTVLMRIGMAQAPSDTSPPALLARLPFDKRGSILHLSAEDHYTNVTTSKGTELVLIRFSDAVGEASPTVGLQTHRSHWVAIKAVQAAEKQGDGAVLTLTTGTEVPVSRSRIKEIRKAGFL